MSPGAWKRASQVGAITGMDWGAVSVLLPAGCDRERVLALLRFWESGMVVGAGEPRPKKTMS